MFKVGVRKDGHRAAFFIILNMVLLVVPGYLFRGSDIELTIYIAIVFLSWPIQLIVGSKIFPKEKPRS